MTFYNFNNYNIFRLKCHLKIVSTYLYIDDILVHFDSYPLFLLSYIVYIYVEFANNLWQFDIRCTCIP
jgi:hypothetical protein